MDNANGLGLQRPGGGLAYRLLGSMAEGCCLRYEDSYSSPVPSPVVPEPIRRDQPSSVSTCRFVSYTVSFNHG